MRYVSIPLFCLTLFAADEAQLALVARAQSDFDRVELTATPRLPDTAACVQSQSALLPVAAPDELPLIHFRKGFCTLAGALITRERRAFEDAAREFDQAIAAWPVRPKEKNKPPEPVSSGLRALAAIAHLEAGPPAAELDRLKQQISAAVDAVVCASNVMPVRLCLDVLAIARHWKGWIAVQQDRLDEASRYFTGPSAAGWDAWVDGRKAFTRADYRVATAAWRRAVTAWQDTEKAGAIAIPRALEPRFDLAAALADLGGAQLLAGDAAGAVASLDQAVRRQPGNARAIFLRARAKDAASQTEAALADYNLASRTAYAQAGDNPSPEAHLYRGVWLYRRGQFAEAEDEFAGALNLPAAAPIQQEVTPWRNLAAVAGGSCGAARDALERSLAAASPFFPREEARKLLASCRPGQTTSAALDPRP